MPSFIRVFIPVIIVLCLTVACKKEYSLEGMPEVPVDSLSEPEVVNYAPYTKGAVYNYMYNTATGYILLFPDRHRRYPYPG